MCERQSEDEMMSEAREDRYTNEMSNEGLQGCERVWPIDG